jgi:hypothetical protein
MPRQLPSSAAPPSEAASEEQPSAERARQNGPTEIAQASRGLLADLEASLQASQRALLARDVAGVEERTREQIRLHRSLEILWSGDAAQAQTSDRVQVDSLLDAALRAAAIRVLHLGRVQAALLTRQQRRLRIVSNLLAGSSASYAPPQCHGVTHCAGREPTGRSIQTEQPHKKGM